MSSKKENIQSVDVEKIEQEIESMIAEIERIRSNNECLDDYNDTLKNKFKYLQKRSDALFKYILTNYGTQNFDKHIFDKNIMLMLNLIKKMQNSNLTQHDASVIVGEQLANQFIPQLKEPKN